MQRAKGEVPEMARAGGAEVPPGWSPKKTGLNDSDVVALVREVRAALAEGLEVEAAWARAKEIAGWNIENRALEGWRSEVLRQAGRPVDAPVLPPKPAPAPAVEAPRLPPAVREALDVALAALVAGRADIAMQQLRELGADGARAPDGWVDRVTARAPRIPARKLAAVAPPREEEPPAGEEQLDEKVDAAEPEPAPAKPPKAAKGAKATKEPKARRSA